MAAKAFDPKLFKSCSRCGGCGEYSFNLMYGTVCFKCGGKGFTADRCTNPATAKNLDEAHAGDIIIRNGVHYVVVVIRWSNNPESSTNNQVAGAIRLVDQATFKMYRTYWTPCQDGRGNVALAPTAENLGKEIERVDAAKLVDILAHVKISKAKV